MSKHSDQIEYCDQCDYYYAKHSESCECPPSYDYINVFREFQEVTKRRDELNEEVSRIKGEIRSKMNRGDVFQFPGGMAFIRETKVWDADRKRYHPTKTKEELCIRLHNDD